MPDDNEDPTDVLTEETKTNLMQKGLVFEQLLQSVKFMQFFALNYDLGREPESKTLYLVEVPDAVVQERLNSVRSAQAQTAPQVVAATPADLGKLIKDIKSANK